MGEHLKNSSILSRLIVKRTFAVFMQVQSESDFPFRVNPRAESGGDGRGNGMKIESKSASSDT